MDKGFFRLLMGLIGLAAFLAVIWVTNGNMSYTASSWTQGGAVALSVAGIFGLLLSLGKF